MAPLVSVQKVSKAFGINPLFTDISLAIEERERVAIVGRNGSGKSTLLRILAKSEEPDSGAVSLRKHLRATYVAQQDVFPEGVTAYEALAAALSDDDHRREQKIGIALGKAGFREKTQAVAAMSGGERKRLAIARGLITEPELLLLDEPTNHLDIAGVVWLEELLRSETFACVFVSHDRFFIENVAERVIELDSRHAGGYFSVTGGYAEFLERRELHLAQLDQYRSSLANRVRREVEWLRRGAKARTTKQKARSDQAVELTRELKDITVIERQARLEFAATERKTRDLIKVEHASKSFGERKIFSDVSVILSPGVRLGIVGLNGSGKTTFLKMLLKLTPPDSGRVTHATRLQVALLDQMRSTLDRSKTLLQTLCPDGDSVVFNGQKQHVTGWARRFLFRVEQLSVPVSSLSGGEQARALIARLMLEPADILILDEPTNDLDIATLEVLEDSLIEFPGAVVLVTHDRYLLDRTCQRVLGLYGAGESALFADHHQWERAMRESTAVKSPSREAGEKRERDSPKKLGYTEQRELSQIESKIEAAELKVSKIQEQMELPEVSTNSAQLQEHCAALAAAQAEVEALYARWQELETKRALFAQ